MHGGEVWESQTDSSSYISYKCSSSLYLELNEELGVMGGHIVHLDKIRSLYQLLQLSHRDPVETTQLLLAELLSLLIFLLLRKDSNQITTLAFVLSVLYK